MDYTQISAQVAAAPSTMRWVLLVVAVYAIFRFYRSVISRPKLAWKFSETDNEGEEEAVVHWNAFFPLEDINDLPRKVFPAFMSKLEKNIID